MSEKTLSDFAHDFGFARRLNDSEKWHGGCDGEGRRGVSALHDLRRVEGDIQWSEVTGRGIGCGNSRIFRDSPRDSALAAATEKQPAPASQARPLGRAGGGSGLRGKCVDSPALTTASTASNRISLSQPVDGLRDFRVEGDCSSLRSWCVALDSSHTQACQLPAVYELQVSGNRVRERSVSGDLQRPNGASWGRVVHDASLNSLLVVPGGDRESQRVIYGSDSGQRSGGDRGENFSERVCVMSEELRKRGFSNGGLLAFHVEAHGKEWALQTLQLSFYAAVSDAEGRLDGKDDFDKLWLTLPDCSPKSKKTGPAKRGGLRVFRAPSNVAQYPLCLIVKLGRCRLQPP